jgi:hypothetical protein
MFLYSASPNNFPVPLLHWIQSNITNGTSCRWVVWQNWREIRPILKYKNFGEAFPLTFLFTFETFFAHDSEVQPYNLWSVTHIETCTIYNTCTTLKLGTMNASSIRCSSAIPFKNILYNQIFQSWNNEAMHHVWGGAWQ